jgi:hypothetical protein
MAQYSRNEMILSDLLKSREVLVLYRKRSGAIRYPNRNSRKTARRFASGRETVVLYRKRPGRKVPM